MTIYSNFGDLSKYKLYNLTKLSSTFSSTGVAFSSTATTSSALSTELSATAISSFGVSVFTSISKYFLANFPTSFPWFIKYKKLSKKDVYEKI